LSDLYGLGCAVRAPVTVPAVIGALLFTILLYVTAHVEVTQLALVFWQALTYTVGMRKRKDPAAVALGRKGGLKGGKARAKAMTPEQRSEASRKAVQARWARVKANSA